MAAIDFANALISTQWVREVTYGTLPGGGAASKWATLSVDLQPEAAITTYTSQGVLVPVGTVNGEEWVSGSIKGPMDYNELTYLFSNILTRVATGTAGGAGDTSAYTYVFTPPANASTTTDSWSMQWGDSAKGANNFQALGVVVPDLTLAFSRKAMDVSGKLLGQRMSTGITMTSSPTGLAKQSVIPSTWDLYAYTAWPTGSLGASGTHLDRNLALTVNITNRFMPVWVATSSATSYVSLVMGALKANLNLTLGADSQSVLYLTNLRSATRFYFRLVATGVGIAGAATAVYTLQLDFACEVETILKAKDDSGVYAHDWVFTLVQDTGGTGKWMEAKIINALATL